MPNSVVRRRRCNCRDCGVSAFYYVCSESYQQFSIVGASGQFGSLLLRWFTHDCICVVRVVTRGLTKAYELADKYWNKSR